MIIDITLEKRHWYFDIIWTVYSHLQQWHLQIVQIRWHLVCTCLCFLDGFILRISFKRRSFDYASASEQGKGECQDRIGYDDISRRIMDNTIYYQLHVRLSFAYIICAIKKLIASFDVRQHTIDIRFIDYFRYFFFVTSLAILIFCAMWVSFPNKD